jgi:predicted metal-binding membrane protein
MTSTKASRTAATLTSTLGLAAACWAVAVQKMRGMDMGAATDLGSFVFFIAVWVPMMAAMMLPGALPAVSRFIRFNGRALAAPLFAGSYLAVWTLVGVAVYALYQPHSTFAAGALTVAAGVYELTPLKRDCRRRCFTSVRSGFQFGLYCVGSSIGLMVVLVALGIMSVTWMSIIAGLILAQKLLPPRASIDVPVALAIVGIGILIVIAPSSIPGLVLPM